MARSNTFEAVAKELMDKFETEGDAPATLKKKQWLLDFANKEFGKRPIAEIKAPEILDALRKIEKRGRHETATRMRSTVGAVFRFAIATGRAERDPTGDLRGALITPMDGVQPRKRRMAHPSRQDEDEATTPGAARPSSPDHPARASGHHRRIKISLSVGAILASPDQRQYPQRSTTPAWL